MIIYWFPTRCHIVILPAAALLKTVSQAKWTKRALAEVGGCLSPPGLAEVGGWSGSYGHKIAGYVHKWSE